MRDCMQFDDAIRSHTIYVLEIKQSARAINVWISY